MSKKICIRSLMLFSFLFILASCEKAEIQPMVVKKIIEKEEPEKSQMKELIIYKSYGNYIGIIDSHTIEIKIGEDSRGFQVSEKLMEVIKELKQNDKVDLEYIVNENNQNVLKEILKNKSEEKIRKEETTLFYIVGKREEKVNAKLNTAENFSIYLPENFQLNKEEGKDSISYKGEKNIYAEIEKIDLNMDVEKIEKEEILRMEKVNKVNKLKGNQIFDNFYRNSEFFLHVSTKEKSENSILIKINGSYYLLKINIRNKEGVEETTPLLYELMKTIESN